MGDKPAANEVIEQYSGQPQVWEKPLAELLVEAGADRDAALLDAASQLLALVGLQPATPGKYNVQVTGDAQGTVIGDHANVSMNFGERPQKKAPRKR